MDEKVLLLKLEQMHKGIKENGTDIKALTNRIYVGNGKSPLTVIIDRNARAVKLILWLLGVVYVSGIAAILKHFIAG